MLLIIYNEVSYIFRKTMYTQNITSANHHHK